MKKRILLLALFVISGISLLGCSAETENEASVSDTETNSSTQGRDSTAVSESTTADETTETSETETANSTEETATSEEDQDEADEEENSQKTVPVREYSEEEKEEVSQEFLEWAIPRAEEGNMAVTDVYFGHGTSGKGDWYAATEDGDMQIQQQSPKEDLPGYDAYDIHALGGVVFYTSSSGITGYDKTPAEGTPGAGGRNFNPIADEEYPLHKYLLGDNGVVYELIGNVDEIGSFSEGYGLYANDGETKEIDEEFTFKVSDDTDAQEEWARILQSYQ